MRTSKKIEESFFDLPSREQKKIIKKATHEANKEQLELHQKADRVCA